MITTPNDRLETLDGIATLDIPLITRRVNLKERKGISDCTCDNYCTCDSECHCEDHYNVPCGCDSLGCKCEF